MKKKKILGFILSNQIKIQGKGSEYSKTINRPNFSSCVVSELLLKELQSN